MARPDGKTTPKRERFIAEYLLDHNGKAAAIRAGYSEKTAAKIAHELLQQPTVRAALDRELKEQQERTLIRADQVLLDINDIADQALMAGEFSAAIRGKELIGKHYGLFVDRQEILAQQRVITRVEVVLVDPQQPQCLTQSPPKSELPAPSSP